MKEILQNKVNFGLATTMAGILLFFTYTQIGKASIGLNFL